MKLNQKAFIDPLFAVALALLIVATAFTMWKINHTDETVSDTEVNTTIETTVPSSTNEEASLNGETEQLDEEMNTVEHFTIILPSGWSQVEGAEKTTGVPEFYYEYSDGTGKTLGISVNSLGFGGGGDGSIEMSIVENRFELSSKYVPCSLENVAGGCDFHKDNGNLVLLGSTADRFNGNNYILWFNDENNENQEAYRVMADIAETIKLL